MIVSILTTAIALLTLIFIAFAIRCNYWREEAELHASAYHSINKHAQREVQLTQAILAERDAKVDELNKLRKEIEKFRNASKGWEDLADRKDGAIKELKDSVISRDKTIEKLNVTVKELMDTVDRQKDVMVEADNEDAVAIEKTKKRDEMLANHTRALLELIIDEHLF